MTHLLNDERETVVKLNRRIQKLEYNKPSFQKIQKLKDSILGALEMNRSDAVRLELRIQVLEVQHSEMQRVRNMERIQAGSRRVGLISLSFSLMMVLFLDQYHEYQGSCFSALEFWGLPDVREQLIVYVVLCTFLLHLCIN